MENIFNVGDKVAFDYEPNMCMTVKAVHEDGTIDVLWGSTLVKNYPQSRLIFSQAIICGKRVNACNL